MNKKRTLIIISTIILVILLAPPIIFKYIDIGNRVTGSTPNLDDDRWKTRKSDYDGINYTYIYMPGKKMSTEDYVQFRKFNNKRDAKKVYNLMKENDYEVLEEKSTYFIGWERDVCDAAVKAVVCISGNTIVTSDIYISSEWATTEDDDSPSYCDYPERLQYVLERYNLTNL